MKLLSIIGLLLLTSCAGLSARTEVLMPAMKIAWVGVSKNVEQGISEMQFKADINDSQAAALRSEIIAMDSALASGDPMRVADVNWHRLYQVAKVGIQARVSDGEIGYAVGRILTLRLDKFHESYVNLLKDV